MNKTINQSINLHCHLQECSQPMRAYETLLLLSIDTHYRNDKWDYTKEKLWRERLFHEYHYAGQNYHGSEV